MKLPFLSRDSFEIAVAAERRRADAEHENAMALRRELQRVSDQLWTYMNPQVTTAAMPAPLVVMPSAPPDAVTQTIREQAGRDAPLAAHLKKYARELKVSGLTPDEIVAKLVAWETSEPSDHAASA